MSSSAALLLLTVVLLIFQQPVTALWNQLSSRPSWQSTAALMVLVLLFFALQPEVRAFLFAVDFIGADIFLIFLFFQGREVLIWSGRALWRPTARALELCSWWPMPMPTVIMFKQSPVLSTFSVAQASFIIFMGTSILAGIAASLT
jgi:hypothetical protein